MLHVSRHTSSDSQYLSLSLLTNEHTVSPAQSKIRTLGSPSGHNTKTSSEAVEVTLGLVLIDHRNFTLSHIHLLNTAQLPNILM